MNKRIVTAIVTCIVAAVIFAGCCELQYGSARMRRIGDQKVEGAYAENVVGPANITVDPNTGLHNYRIDANGIYTRFQFDSQESKGEFPPMKDITEAFLEAMRLAGLIPAVATPD